MANTTGKKFGGRKKGTPNKDTKQLRDKIDMLLNEQWPQIKEDLKDLKPKDRIDTYIKLLEYSLPKLNRQYLNTDPEGETTNRPLLNIDPLSDKNTPIFNNNPLEEPIKPPIQWLDDAETKRH